MSYDADISELCWPEAGQVLSEYARQCDDGAIEALKPLYAARDDMLPALMCTRGMTAKLALSVTPYATSDYVTFLLQKIWGLKGELDQHPEGKSVLGPDFIDDLRTPFTRLTYDPPSGESRYPKVWFGCARALDVDLREDLEKRIVWDWSFIPSGFDYSETWAHTKYLSSYNDEKALSALHDKLDTVIEANVIYNMLTDLVNTPVLSEGTLDLVADFQDDPRETDVGIRGVPTVPVGEQVRNLLARLEQ